MSTWYDITIDCWKLNKTRMKKLKSSLRKFGFKIIDEKENTFEISMTIPLKQLITEDGQPIKEVDCNCNVDFNLERISFGQGCYGVRILSHIAVMLILDKIIEWIPTIFSSGTIVRTHCECDLCSTGVVTQDEFGFWGIAWAETPYSYDEEDKTRL